MNQPTSAVHLVQHEESELPEDVIAAANRENHHYFVSLFLDSRPAGSATLVRVGELHGLLTAAHVADFLTRSKIQQIGIICSDRPHCMLISRDHISVLCRARGSDDSNGPDIAFIVLHDTKIVGQLKATKSFYQIESFTAARFEAIQPPQCRLCFVSGAPGEFWSEGRLDETENSLRSATHFFARAQIIGCSSDGQFDYFDLSVLSGHGGFPQSYEGVSGGAVWHIPLTIDDNGGKDAITYEKPELIGIAFYQTAGTDRRIIRAHGYRGIANLLQQHANRLHKTEVP